MKAFFLMAAIVGGPALATIDPIPEALARAAAQIVIVGEVHDNPGHHVEQAIQAANLLPQALVFEMLTPEQAARITPQVRSDASELEQALGWDAAGWPDFAMYYPIIANAPQARIYGAAVPRAAARAALDTGIVAAFGPEAPLYGLTTPLPADQQADRLALQRAAHCDALPEDMLPGMVDLQRLRDATLARTALQALDETGGPVLVITGNGHARKDWGMPAYLVRVRPDLAVYSVGQDEEGVIDGTFDEVWPGAAVAREDPCAAFR